MYRRLVLVEGDQPLLMTQAATRDAAGVPTPFDLTGATIRWVSKASADTADAAGTEIIGQVWPDAGPGGLAVQLTAAVTAAPGAYWHKLRVETPDSQKRTVSYGPLDVVNA
jgi:hypothetical protein